MIEINLLPEELRKRSSRFKLIDLSGLNLSKLNMRQFRDLPLIKIAALLVGVLIAFHVILFVVGICCEARLRALSARYDKLLPLKKEADALKAQSESINSKVGAINSLMVKRFSWARRLSSISESMTSGVWLSELSYESKVAEKAVQSNSRTTNNKKKTTTSPLTEKVVTSSLVISGYTSQMGESGAALVGKFIKSLKTNADFYSDFSDIALVSIKSDKVDNQEVMNFKITCPFKDNRD